VTWTLVPGSPRTLTMAAPVLAGLAVTSHQGSTAGQTVFEQVVVG
jgi:hypothetical protein